MKASIVGYWICTILAGLSILSGGIGQLMHQPQTVEGMTHLGYPLYFVTILGAWKILGALVVFAPKLPLLKEWAYAGIVFDLTGATMSHLACGDDVRHAIVPLVLAALAVGSWALRPESRKLSRS